MRWPDRLVDTLRGLAAAAPRRWRVAGGVGAAALASLAVWTAASAAIDYVGASEAYNPNLTSTLSVARPAGVASGDLLLAAIAQPETNTINTPSGWTLVATSQLNALNNPNLRVFYRVATGAEPTSYSFTTVGSESMAGGIAVFRGIDAGNPVAASAVQANTTASTSAVAPSVTPGVADTLLVSVWATQDGVGSNPTVTVPAGMTRVVGASMMAANTAETRLTMAYQPLSASTATGTRTAALSASYRSNTASIALRPAGYTVSGTVFEDVNYGGGAGRSLAASGGVGVPGATVELYRASGAYVGSATTDSGGVYRFTGLAAEGYVVRVLTSSVRSTRSGNVAGLWPVQTWRYESSWQAPAAVTDEVGGQRPDVVDSAAALSLAWTNCAAQLATCNVGGTRLVRYGIDTRWVTRVVTGSVACGNGAFGDPAVGETGKTCEVLQPHLHSASSVHLSSAGAAGVDFGFNFDTVVNTNDSGQGSLRQALVNANTLAGDASLAQAGRPAAIENLVFMIGNGTAGGGGSLSLSGGLRAAYNLFTTGAGGYNAATITPGSAFPTVTAPIVIDAQTQPGWTANPVVELRGNGLGATLLHFSGGNSRLRGFVINRLGSAGNSAVRLDTAGGNTVQGNWLGLDVSGATATTAQRAGYQIEIYSGANLVGGAGSAQRNVISNGGSNGVVIWGGSANVVQGNYIGTNAAGTAALGSSDSGIVLPASSTATGTVIGGVNAGEGNVISGHGGGGNPTGGIAIQGSGATGSVIRGNSIGSNAAGTAAIASGGYGIYVASANTTVGGTAAGAGNTVTGHALSGVAVVGGTTSAVAIQGNAIYGNTGIGIDLAGNGATANDGAKTASQPNLLMDAPVFTAASLSGASLTVTGYVGSAASQSAFAGARVEVFVSDASSSAGQGRTYLGAVTADASGNFNGALTVPAGVTLVAGSTRLTGTATDAANNTSEFGTNFAFSVTVAGTVFEDVHYGGGAGRSRAASGGVGIAGASVELYRAIGTYVASTTTAADGSYGFATGAPEAYIVRVLTSSVRSTRSGSAAGLWPVQTWRYEGSAQAPAAVANEVGGQQPGVADSGAAPTLVWSHCANEGANCTFSGTRLVRYGADTRWTTRVLTDGTPCTNGSFGDAAPGTGKTCKLLTQHLHSASSVQTGSGGAGGIDFGFSFDTVVNTNDSGQGSLRQAILNANTLGGDAGLAQAGRSAGIENLIFMIGDGSNAAGLRSQNFFTTPAGSSTAATIAVASALPALTSPLVIDAQTQPGWTLQPRIEIKGGGLTDTLLTMSAGNSVLRGFVVNRLGGGSALRLETAGGNTVQGNWLGPDASGASATTSAQAFHQIEIESGGNTVGGATAAARNVISNARFNGIVVRSGAANAIQGNHIGTTAPGDAALPNGDSGIVFPSDGSATNTLIGGVNAAEGNLISGNAAPGPTRGGIAIQGAGSTGTVIRGNRIGVNAAGSATIASNGAGIYVAAPNTAVGGTAAGAGNTVRGHVGSGVVVVGAAGGVSVLGNSVYGNGGLGIDLGDNGVTANDGAKTSGQPNVLMDRPVITAARARGKQLTVSGYVGTAAGQTLFGGSRVEIFISDSSSGFGSGQTYLGALTTDAGGNFSGTLTMPIAALRAGSALTGTATDTANNTSEFGANFTAVVLDWLINHNGDAPDANPGDGLCETATAGQCTLRAALMEANAFAGTETAAFALPDCPGAGCVITPASSLPIIGAALILDAQTQPGWAQAPLVELVGSSAGNAHGLHVAAAGVTVRGLSIGGFGQSGNQSGIYLDASNATIEGNHVGLAADGVTARPNGASNSTSAGVFVNAGTGHVIGGSSAAQRNVLSGNGGSGYWAYGGTGTLTGNYIGTDAAGASALGNGRWGVQISAAGAHQIGGAAAGQGNVVSGNVGNPKGGILVAASATTIQGNTIGLNAARSAALPNGDGSSTDASGIDVRAGVSNVLIGGTNPGEGNVIAGNAGHGVRVASQSTRLLGNSVYGNAWLGIDLNGDGVTANDGAVSASQPNNGMDQPVIGAAGYDPATRVLTLIGAIGTGSGQAVFAGARIEFFKSDGDGSGYGEGSAFVGTLTADGSGRFSGSVTVPAGVSFAVGTPVTGTATDASGNTSEFGRNFVTTTVSGMAPSRFNAFETATPAGALSGVIKTMTAGQAVTLAVIAVDSSGSALSTTFAGTVTLEWMDARDPSGALAASGCRSSWTSAGPAGSATFVAGAGRMNVALTPSAVGREWRLRLSHTSATGTTVVACSTDNFAVKPASLVVTALGSADSSTAGVGGGARSLTNGSAGGGVVHRAGRPFALRAQAQTATGALATGYDGTVAIALAGCVLPASGCTLGGLQHQGGAASLSASAGALASDTMTYSEVGAITVRLTDTGFADIDAADSTPAERLIQSADTTIGRFVPDRYATALATAGVLNTINAACTAAGAGYTFFGQAFGWATLPQLTVTALNAQGATTTNWAGALQRLNPASHVTQTLAVTGLAGAGLSQTHGAITLTDLGGGTARLAAQAPASFALGRDPAAPVASGTPVFGWAASITDTSEAAVTGNGSITGAVAQPGIAFNQGGVFHTGRLALAPGHGDARTGVRLLVELQRYSAAGWVTMTEDRGCITVKTTHVTVAAPQGAGVCAAPVKADVTLRGGRAWMELPGRAAGRVTAGLNLAASSSGLACQAMGSSVPSVPMNLPHLMGAWGGAATLTAEPRAALTWGRPNRDVVLTREQF